MALSHPVKRKDTGAAGALGQPATMKLQLKADANTQPTRQPVIQEQHPGGPDETVFSTSPDGLIGPQAPFSQPAAAQTLSDRTQTTNARKGTKDTMATSVTTKPGHTSKPSDAMTLGADNRASEVAEKPKAEPAKLVKGAKRSRCCFLNV